MVYFSGGFIEFLTPLIDDVNFKVCLTTLNMLTKMLVLDVVLLSQTKFSEMA